MLLYLSLTGIFLSVILLYFNARKFPTTIYLGIFFLCVSLYGLNYYVLLYSKSVFYVSIIAANITFLYYLIGPMLYWYTRSILTDNSSFKKSDLWHLLPTLVYLTAAIPYILSPYSQKVEIATAIVKDAGFMGQYKFTVLSEMFSVSVVYLSRLILILVYTLWSIGLFIRYLLQRREVMVLSLQNFMIKWLTVLLGFQFILINCHLVTTFETFEKASDVFFTINVLQALSMAGLAGLLISPFFFPGILYGLPRMPISIKEEVTEDLETNPLPINAKKNFPNFESDYILSIKQKSDLCMEENQPFLQPDFNLTHFSVLTKVPVHHLAYYFRDVKKQSFNDFRNEWRIKYAKKLIKAGKAKGQTLEAIGLQSGFSNRNTFLTAFKKVEGISPSVFVSQAIE